MTRWSPLRSRHVMPAALILVAFTVSRAWASTAGVRFDASTLPWFWQFIDPTLLKEHLAQSLWYFHAQPPLYNLLLGIGVKLFGSGSGFATAAADVQMVLGVAIAFALYAVLLRVGLGRWWAAAIAAFFIVSPAAILYENWLFYEYLVTALLLFAAVAFVLFERRPTAARAFAVFLLLALLCYTRASFQVLVMILALAFMLVAFRGHRRAILLGAALPIALVLALSVKNWALFGTVSTSSWAGMNLMEIDQSGFRGHELDDLQHRGIVSSISSIPAFRPLGDYAGVVPPDKRYAGIPVLADTTKPSADDTPNFNNIRYVDISNRYFHDFLQVLVHDPAAYLRGIWDGIELGVLPSTDYAFFDTNREKMSGWARGYNAAVLWQPRAGKVAWGIVFWYLVVFVLGLREAVIVLRRRGGSASVAFVWLLMAYATLVLTFGEVEENQRIRFVTDPLVLILGAVFVARGVTRVPAVRRVVAGDGAAPARLHWPTERP